MGREELNLLVEAPSVYDFQQFLKQNEYPVQGNINYAALLSALQRRFAPGQGFGGMIGDRDGSGFGDGSGRGNRTCFERMFAFVSINPEHEGQQKFCAFLRGQGFTVDETDYRDAFVVPDRKSPYQRLSSRITYVAGLLAAPFDKKGKARELPHLIVVTDAFDVYYPLLDYVENRNGRVTIAFFRRGMEERWQRAGLFDDDSPIKFFDLSDDARMILGVDLGSSLGRKEGGRGLADFKL